VSTIEEARSIPIAKSAQFCSRNHSWQPVLDVSPPSGIHFRFVTSMNMRKLFSKGFWDPICTGCVKSPGNVGITFRRIKLHPSNFGSLLGLLL
jgi:hypothetical protein